MMNSITPVTPVSAAASSAATSDLVGEFVGKYRVVRKLGQGGMGTVYEAVHSDIGQRVAIKILNADMSGKPSFVKRFFDEARLVSMVSHPGLVKIYDFNQLPDGTLYIMMEHLEGQSLWERFSTTRGHDGTPGLPVSDAMRFTRQLASALVAVHAKGIVHRDLKPDNVILVADPETPKGERVKLLDFGIAKQDAEDEGARRTTAGVTLGTPTYMSPEQCEGLSKLTDRADVYALGVMLFELLSGEPPFRSESTSAIMCQHLTKSPPLLPSHIPEAVVSLVRAMLAKEPTARPAMEEIVARIDNLGALRSGVTIGNSLSRVLGVAATRRRATLILTIAGLGIVLMLFFLLRGRGAVGTPELPQSPVSTQPAAGKAAPSSLQVPGPLAGSGDTAAPRVTPEAAVLPVTVPQKSKPSSKGHGPSRIIFGTKKSSKDKKSHS